MRMQLEFNTNLQQVGLQAQSTTTLVAFKCVLCTCCSFCDGVCIVELCKHACHHAEAARGHCVRQTKSIAAAGTSD
jgi:hypothetical protein